MVFGTDLAKAGIKTVTNSIKPLSLWSNSLKKLAITHPAGFFMLTSGAIVGLGVYHLTTNMLNKKKIDKLDSELPESSESDT